MTFQNKALPPKTVNLIFLILTILILVGSSINIPFIPKAWGTLIAYIPTLIIAIILCRKKEANFSEAFAFKGAKPLSFLLAFIIAIAALPLVRLVSELTGLVFPSLMQTIAGAIMGDQLIIAIISTAVIPVIFEEFFLRGTMLNSYNTTGRYRLGIIVTAILFGLFHMNFSQFFYATVLGIIIGIVFTLTGSVFPGMIMHLVNNGISILMSALYGTYGVEFMQEHFSFMEFGFADTAQTIKTIISAIIGLVIICLCIRAMAKVEGCPDRLTRIVKGGYEGEKQKIASPTLVIALILLAIGTVFVSFVIPIYLNSMQG
ncbi:MAG: CPBP family intramembrane metalloprotease [Lachnospiraceae bacterium]|nr:CPBP family intramembrane metalloprotease [Lachnospiraceae bacterium]